MAGYNVVKTQRGLPIGSVQPWGGNLTEIPAGWLLCNGAELEAADYPLLARVLRETYGGTSFAGDFPNYTGTFRLPPTNNKALADISTAYFGTYTATGTIPTTIDNSEALTVVQEFIGDSVPGDEPGDLGPPNVVNARTDLNFTYTPEPDGTIKTITHTGTAPTVTASKLYKNVAAVAGTNATTGQAVTGTGATFTIVLNPDGTYDVVPKDKGSGYKVKDRLTISGSTFSADGGASPANNIEITVESKGDSTFDGIIEGQKIIPGFSIKPVFVAPRKLGRNHFPQHYHEGSYETINLNDVGATAGRGVGVFANPEVNAREYWNRIDPCPCNYPFTAGINPCEDAIGPQGLDCTKYGYWFGSGFDNNIEELKTVGFTTGVGRHAIGSIKGTKPVNDHVPIETAFAAHGIGATWFNDGKVKKLRDADGNTGGDMETIRSSGKISAGMKIPFSDSAAEVTAPNFDENNNGSDNTLGPTEVLFNHAGIKFTNDTPTGGGIIDVIESHDHDGEFQISYDGSDLDVPETINVKVQPQIIPNSIENCFQISFTTRVASLTITNLIRAY